jgi:hypothetical protein
MDLFELNGRVVVNLADAVKAFEEIKNEGQQTESKLGKAFGKVGRGAAVVGKTILKGLAVGGAAMAGLTVKALNLSGELEQNIGGSEAVFKEYADEMQNTAKEAFSNMGLSTSDYLATANKMGALFQGAGFSIEESMNLSSDAMQRAADVASIMGIDTSAAMEAVAGAAKGNFTMMDNLGVAMNDTAIQAYALEHGIDKTTAEMTQQEKIGLAMEMFMEKTAYATGNYAKENESLAGSLTTAKAALTNFLDGSGDVDSLVSAFSNAARVIIENVSEIAPRLIEGLSEVVQEVIPMIPPLLEEFLPVIIDGAVSLINSLVAALPSILDLITTSALPMVLEGIVTIFNSLVAALPGLVESLCAALPTLIPMLIEGIVSMFVTLCTNFGQIIQPIIDILPEIVILLVDSLMANLPALIEGCISLVMAIVEAIPQITIALVEAMPSVIVSLVGGLLSAAPLLIQGMIDIWTSVKEGAAEIWASITTVVTDSAIALKDAAIEKFNYLKENAGEIWTNIKDKASSLWESTKTAVVNKAQAIWTGITSKFNSMKTSISNIWNNVKTAIQNPIESARDLVENAIEKIKGFFDFEFSWPNLPMPHFSISPSGWKIGDLLQGSIPSLGISWYAKAMDNPMIMDSPTIFGYNPATGKLLGGGEEGSEVVSGTNTLMHMIGTAVETNTAVHTDRIIVVLTAILDALLSGNREMLEAILAGHVLQVGEREFGRLVKEYA